VRKYPVLIFILFELCIVPKPKLLGENREHAVLGIHTGYSYAPKEEWQYNGMRTSMRYTTHHGYDLQIYFFKNIGIQFEFQRQLKQSEINSRSTIGPNNEISIVKYRDDYYFLNLIYKFNTFEKKGLYPYLLIGRGGVYEGELSFDLATKMGGGTKYRPFKKLKVPTVNFNFGFFYFIPDRESNVYIESQKRHLSLYLGIEIGI
jgi:hypothetical protein